jgi:ribosomal protein S18 acetylase RimI-like enzyme
MAEQAVSTPADQISYLSYQVIRRLPYFAVLGGYADADFDNEGSFEDLGTYPTLAEAREVAVNADHEWHMWVVATDPKYASKNIPVTKLTECE